MELTSLNLKNWVNQKRPFLKPPINNKMIWKDREFIVMIVGGPNQREDYHINEGEEFFYQIEGDIVLRIMQDESPCDLPIKEGEIFLLPPSIPHSPQRPAKSIGMVIERKRREGEKDGFAWYCLKCHHPLYLKHIELKNIEKDLPLVFEGFYKHKSHHVCKKCGTLYQKRESS